MEGSLRLQPSCAGDIAFLLRSWLLCPGLLGWYGMLGWGRVVSGILCFFLLWDFSSCFKIRHYTSFGVKESQHTSLFQAFSWVRKLWGSCTAASEMRDSPALAVDGNGGLFGPCFAVRDLGSLHGPLGNNQLLGCRVREWLLLWEGVFFIPLGENYLLGVIPWCKR